MNLAKQKLHFLYTLQVEGVCSELCSEMLIQVQASLPIALLYGGWQLILAFCCVLAITTF